MQKKYFGENRGSELLKNLYNMRLENQLCDVILKIPELSIPAHRNVLAASSPFFNAMFCGMLHCSVLMIGFIYYLKVFSGKMNISLWKLGLFSESSKRDVTLHEIDPSALEMVINYMYTGELEIHVDNVQNLLSTATFLQISFVQEKCCEFLAEALDPNNCIGIRRFAAENNCLELKEQAENFAAGCYHKVVDGDEFLQLEFDEIRVLLSNPKIHHHSDDTIFMGLMRWANHDPATRSKYLKQLLTFVHPCLVGKHLVKSQDILMNTPSCSEWISKTLDTAELEWNIFFLDKIGKHGDLYRYGLKTQTTVPLAEYPEKAFAISMVGHQKSIYVQGGAIDRKSTSTHYCYNIYRNEWMKLNNLMLARSHQRSCVLNAIIYIIGGNGITKCPLASVECYDLHSGKAFDVEEMYQERSSMGASVLDNQLYVMGGENENQCLFTAERFDPRIGYWETLASMNQVNSYCSSAVVSGSVYCSEGIGNCMERYDVRMNRWDLIEFKTDREFYELFSIENILYSISGSGIYKYCFTENEWWSVLDFPCVRSWDTALPLQMQVL